LEEEAVIGLVGPTEQAVVKEAELEEEGIWGDFWEP